MSSQTADGPAGDRAPARRQPLAWMRNAPIRRKLAVIVAIPLATVATLTALRMSDNIHEASAATQLRNLTTLSQAAADLTDKLTDERIAAARYLLTAHAAPRAFTDRTRASSRSGQRYKKLRRKLEDVPGAVSSDLREIDRYLATLPALRRQVLRHGAPGSSVALRYELVIDSLNAYRSGVAQHTGGSSEGNPIRAAALFSAAKADVGYEQAIAYIGLQSGRFGNNERATFTAALHAQEQSLVSFMRIATPQQRRIVSTTVAGDAVQLADTLSTGLSRGTEDQPKVSAEDVARALGAMSDLMRWTEQQLDRGVATDVAAYHDEVIGQVTVETLSVLAAVLLALLASMVLARTMSRSLSRLGQAADTVARRDLPQAVAKLHESGHVRPSSLASLVADSYDPIQVSGTYEIGRVAQSFNGVHREALRIALEQAVQRMNASTTFVSLARRSQKLVDKMISRLDQIESNEQTPERLAELIELDHLATRMRRNDENLLILADADSGSAYTQDVLLPDVIAAAQSEIARNERIEIGPLNLSGSPGEAVTIHAAAVNDMVRLFAELMENAAAFSPPSRPVVVIARRVADHALVEIEDHGIGMTQERRDELNARLADRHDTSVSSVRMMGVEVVRKLAVRHDIKVHLSSAGERGTVAHVTLPAGLVSIGHVAPTRPTTPRHGTARTVSGRLGGPAPAALPRGRAEQGTSHSPNPENAVRPGPTRTPATTTAADREPPVIPGLATAPDASVRHPLPRRDPQPPARPTTPDPRSLPVLAPASSDWFDSPTARTAGEEPVKPARPAPDAGNTRAGGDGRARAASQHPGWHAAAQAQRPTVTGRTEGGLPRREPMAQLVPGGFDTPRNDASRDPSEVRTLLSEYQRGVSTGRDRRPTPPPSTFAPTNHPTRNGESPSP